MSVRPDSLGSQMSSILVLRGSCPVAGCEALLLGLRMHVFGMGVGLGCAPLTRRPRGFNTLGFREKCMCNAPSVPMVTDTFFRVRFPQWGQNTRVMSDVVLETQERQGLESALRGTIAKQAEADGKEGVQGMGLART